MKNKKMILGIAIILVIGFSMIACNKSGGSSGGGGGKSLNSPEALKEYLDSQPANSPDKPIKVSMGANAPMLPKIRDVLNSSGKYVSLNITGDALTTIPENAFYDRKHICETLVSITIPKSVTSIGYMALFCPNLTSITFQGTIDEDNLDYNAFIGDSGDLRKKYLAGGIGTYIATEMAEDDGWIYPEVWTKK